MPNITSRWCPRCEKYGAAQKQGPSHLLHFAITLLTCVFWLPMWILLTLSGTWNCMQCGAVTWSSPAEGWLRKLVLVAGAAVAIPLAMGVVAAYRAEKPVPPRIQPIAAQAAKPVVAQPVAPEQPIANAAPANAEPIEVQPQPANDEARAAEEAAAAKRTEETAAKAAVERKSKRDAEAASKLAPIAALIRAEKTAAAEKRLKEIIEQYPDTPSAAEAEAMLKKLK